MCGIVGYVGGSQAAPIILDALEKLEYRGYDSAGIAVAHGGTLTVKKSKGRLKVLRGLTDDGASINGTTGIGHTRWATHGEPSDVNSHPHLSLSGKIAVVHNGIIENYIELRRFLTSHGYSFVTETDTEVISQMIDFFYAGDSLSAVRNAVRHFEGSYAIGILFADEPDKIVAVCKDSPLIVGIGDGENFIASDVTAILKHTRRIFRMCEQEIAVIERSNIDVYNAYGERIEKEPIFVTWDANAAEKGGYEHFMIKEIVEQPDVIRKTASPRIKNGQVELGLKNITDDDIRSFNKIYIVGCGSAYHVGKVGRQIIERFANIPVTVELASEFRYDNPFVDSSTLTIVISQSGETMDTLYALKEARKRGSRVISIVNVVGSTIASESEDVVYTWAGPEIAVATTKAYTAQLIVLYLTALYFGQVRACASQADIDSAIKQIERLPEVVGELIESREQVQYLASLYFNSKDIFFIGRNIDYALALEGSLKLKEISYIHSEAYAAGELKHGTISLIEGGTLVIALCTYAPLRDKMISNIREVKARGAVVIALARCGDTAVAEAADHVIYMPEWEQLTMPSLTIIPLQLFAYYVASLKGCDIDKPRNLAKSVTVE